MRKSASTIAVPGSWGVPSVSHTVTGLLRRFVADQSPENPTTSSSSFGGHTNDFDNFGDIYNPRAKNISPLLSPYLHPVSLNHGSYFAQDSATLLTKSLAEEIRLLVPPRLQLCEEWNIIYSLERDGASLATLYKNCREFEGRRNGFVLIVKDGKGDLFGAYLNEAPRVEPNFFGNGECFLWRATFLSASQMELPLLPSANTLNMQRSTTIASQNLLSPVSINQNHLERTKSNSSNLSERIRFKAFPYSGINDYFILCDAEYLSIGGGDGRYGLWLDDTFDRGISSHCLTFGNEPMSDEGEKFDVIGVEIWSLGDISTSTL